MNYFDISSNLKGWSTKNIIKVLGEKPKPEYISYKQIDKIMEEFDKVIYYRIEKLDEYYKALKDIEQADLILVVGDDTLSSKTHPFQSQLSIDHPANLQTQLYSKRLEQLKIKKGVTSYIAQIRPPEIPQVYIPGIGFHPDLKKYHSYFGFIAWDDIKKQEEKYTEYLKRAEIYKCMTEMEYDLKTWDKKQESLLLKGLEAIIVEKMVDFIANKCDDRLLILMRNIESKKKVKDEIIKRIKKIRPSIIEKENLVDIVSPLIFKGGYQKELTCSTQVVNRFTNLIENFYNFKYSGEDRKPKYKGFETVHWDVIDRVLKKYKNKDKIKDYIVKKIKLPTIETVLGRLNFNLWHDLEPLALPGEDVKEFDASCSEICAPYDVVEFHLKKEGLYQVPEDIEFLGEVGRVCHEAAYASASERWKVAMEKSGSLHLDLLKDGKDVVIRFTPDVIGYHSKDIGPFPIDLKSGVAPFETWMPKTRHRLQVAGYSWFLEHYAKEQGLEAPESRLGAIVYLQDYYADDPRWPIKVKTDSNSKSRSDFILKAIEFISHRRKWVEDSEEFLKYCENKWLKKSINPKYKEHARTKELWPAIIRFAEDNWLDVKYKDLLEKINNYYNKTYGENI